MSNQHLPDFNLTPGAYGWSAHLPPRLAKSFRERGFSGDSYAHDSRRAKDFAASLAEAGIPGPFDYSGAYFAHAASRARVDRLQSED